MINTGNTAFQMPLIAFIFILLPSCSLIKKKVDYVSIDSNPRGLRVKKITDAKKVKTIGKTPMFDEDFKESKSQYLVEYRLNKKTITSAPMEKMESCGMIWNDPLMENIPLVKKVVPEDDSFLSKYNPLKLVKSGKLDCSIKIRYATSPPLKVRNQKKCGHYLIIPPVHKYKHISNLIMKDWIDKVFRRQMNKCDKLISPASAEELLTFLGFHHLSDPKEYGLEYQMYGKIAQLGYKLKATHLVFLHHSKVNDTIYLNPKVYDIFNLKRSRKKFEKLVKRKIKVDDEVTFWDRLEDAVQLFPNSIALKFTFYESLHLDPAEFESRYPTVKDSINIPPSIRLTNVYYPLQRWGLNFRFSPSITITDWDEEYDIDFYMISMAMKLYAHTPIGTLTGRLGAGYSYVTADNIKTGFEQSGFTPVTHWGVEYYYFLDERYYVNLGYRRNQIRVNEIKDGDFNLKEFSSYFFSIGYYTPELQLKIKNWFN